MSLSSARTFPVTLTSSVPPASCFGIALPDGRMMVPPGGRNGCWFVVAKSIRVVQSPLSGFSGCTTTGSSLLPLPLYGCVEYDAAPGCSKGGKPGSLAVAAKVVVPPYKEGGASGGGG
jgi:hypothetical protein